MVKESFEYPNKIIDLFKDSYMYMPVFLAVDTGMRLAEILSLTWSDVDFDKGVITISRSIFSTNAQGLTLKELKNKTSKRSIDIPTEVISTLKKHKTSQKYQNASDLICSLQNGDPIAPATVTKNFREVAKAAGYKINFHQLRHAHARFLQMSEGEKGIRYKFEGLVKFLDALIQDYDTELSKRPDRWREGRKSAYESCRKMIIERLEREDDNYEQTR